MFKCIEMEGLKPRHVPTSTNGPVSSCTGKPLNLPGMLHLCTPWEPVQLHPHHELDLVQKKCPVFRAT